MLRLLLIILVLFLISGFLRRIFFSSAYNAYIKAAQDLNKKNKRTASQQAKQKNIWSTNNSSTGKPSDNDGEYVDYEEIR